MLAVMETKKRKLEDWQVDDAASLKRLFDEKSKLSQEDFGAKFEIGSQGMVWQYLNARSPLNLPAAIKFANGLGVKVSDFSPTLGRQLEPISTGFGDMLKSKLTGAPTDVENVGLGPDIRGKVPLISWVRAGAFSEVVDLLQPGEAIDWVETTVQQRAHTFALRVEGDSMEPIFPAGTILIVEPELEAHANDYVIVKNGSEEATFKQLVKDGGDWYLKPLNPRYPLKPFVDCHVVGVVRAAERRFR
jgi:SOS-response transcriptional repressor LexA